MRTILIASAAALSMTAFAHAEEGAVERSAEWTVNKAEQAGEWTADKAERAGEWTAEAGSNVVQGTKNTAVRADAAVDRQLYNMNQALDDDDDLDDRDDDIDADDITWDDEDDRDDIGEND